MSNKFKWGNSTSSMQSEGAWNLGGKGPSVYDVIQETETTSNWEIATDSYHRYQEDFDLMKEMGMNFYRFQISWSRIFPNGDGNVNPEGIAFYHKFIDELIKRDIEPMICLYHFDMPLHLSENYDGFASSYTKDSFVNYGKLLIDEFSGKVKWWITFNEHNLFGQEIAFKISGSSPGGEKKLYTIMHNTILAHAEISKYLRSKDDDCKIGCMLAYRQYYPLTSCPEDNFLVETADLFHNKVFLDAMVLGRYPESFLKYLNSKDLVDQDFYDSLKSMENPKSDFISFSYYTSFTLDSNLIEKNTPMFRIKEIAGVDNPYLEPSYWGRQIDPLGFRTSLRKLYNEYNIPLFPVENGIGVEETLPENEYINDDYRIEYHENHIKNMLNAIEIDGVEIIGYLGWGLIDILSSKGEMDKRYGFVYVNRDNHNIKDLRRIKKHSFYWFKDFLKNIDI